MSKFKNMKIAITPEQPLDEVVRDLERLGYRWCVDTKHNYSTKCIVTFTNGLFDFFYGGWRQYDLTTISELKEIVVMYEK